MSRRSRRTFTAEQKAAAVVRHLQDGVPVSQLCDELEIHPNQFYDWQKQALGNLSKAFERESDAAERRQARQVSALEAKLSDKNDVIAELLGEHLALKKTLGVD